MGYRALAREYIRLALCTAFVAAASSMTWRILVSLGDTPDSFAPHLRSKYTEHLGLVLTHGFAGCTALAVGLPQMIGGFRKRYPAIHRAVGMVYLAAVLVSGTTALPMAWMAFGGLAAQSGFLLLGLSWLATALLAIRALLRQEIAEHGRWMKRNYGLTFSAVMVRAWLTIAFHLELPIETSYVMVAWLSWVPTALCVELMLVSSQRVHIRRLPVRSDELASGV